MLLFFLPSKQFTWFILLEDWVDAMQTDKLPHMIDYLRARFPFIYLYLQHKKYYINGNAKLM